MQLISDIKDYERCLAEVKRFLPYINNWATCDIPRPKCFAKHKTELLPVIKEWIASGNTYTIRYGIGTLMSFYLDEDFKPEYIELVASVQSEEYYVNMMIAWYLATALANSGMQRSHIWKNESYHRGCIERRFRKRWRAIASQMSRKFI